MLTLTIAPTDLWDGSKEIFVTTKERTVKLEHSLISVSKWEAESKVPFFASPSHKGLSGRNQEVLYISHMIVGEVPAPYVPGVLYAQHASAIRDYIHDEQSATKIYNIKKGPKRIQTITSEIIYHWMIQHNIPVEFEKWHLNRLLKLIEVCLTLSSKDRMSSEEAAKYRAKLNEARRRG